MFENKQIEKWLQKFSIKQLKLSPFKKYNKVWMKMWSGAKNYVNKLHMKIKMKANQRNKWERTEDEFRSTDDGVIKMPEPTIFPMM